MALQNEAPQARPAARQQPRSRLRLACAVAAFAVILVLLLVQRVHEPAGERRGRSGPVTGVPPPPIAPQGPAESEDGVAADAPLQRDAAGFHPELRSADRNLSHARRAGLHRAPDPLRLTASAAIALDATTGAVLYAKNAQAILPVASLTKLMTALVLLDTAVPLNQVIRIAPADVDTLRHSRSRLRVGTLIRRHEALRLALMSSENRAAHALARTAGGVPAFVDAMNRKARELGMESTTFVDPTGLSNGNRATATDVAKLVRAASAHALLKRYSTTQQRRVRVGKASLRYLNSNRLVRQRWPVELQKTGYIVEAGQCVAMSLRARHGRTIMVLLDSGSIVERGRDAARLRAWVERQPLSPG